MISMKVRLIPESLPIQAQRFIRQNGSEAAQVKRLMRELERSTDLVKNPEAMIKDAEQFPHEIANSTTNMVRKLLDVI